MESKFHINAYERVDDLHRNGLKIIQDPQKFCFGSDAVILSGFVKAKKGDHVMDLGTGTGIIPLLLTAKTNAAHITGLEIQPDMADMAKRSVSMNALDEKITIVQGDIKTVTNAYKPASFQVVVTNPPYMNEGGGLVSAANPMAVSRHELLCTLDDVLAAAATLLETNGRFYMIHRPHRLGDIMYLLRHYKLEPKTLRFVQPSANKDPNMVLVEGVKGGKPMARVMSALVVYGENSEYTEEIQDIYYR